MILYRVCNYHSPLRSSFQAQRRAGRYHRGSEEEPTQYLCMHPLGPLAEAMRRTDARNADRARALDLRTWALDVPLDGLIDIAFEDDWVADDYRPSQDLADSLRASGWPGAIVPSAALPGTRNVILFGGGVAAPYAGAVLDRVEMRASITGEHGCGLASLVELVRFRGDPHPGAAFAFSEPSWRHEAA